MNLTEGARRDLERYLRQVRVTLTGRADVDLEDVVEGIREHVEAALGHREADPATVEDLADVLERLGPPDRWDDEDAVPVVEPGRAGPGVEDSHDPTATRARLELVPLVLTGTGGTLVLVERAVPLGWALIVVGAVTARIVLPSPGRETARGTVGGTLVRILWHVSAIGGTAALLLLPAALIWAQSQIGGVLEPYLLERTLPLGTQGSSTAGNRPPGYWPLAGLLAGSVTGGWWLLLGALGRAARERVRRGLGSADYLASRRALRGALICGGMILIASVILLVAAAG